MNNQNRSVYEKFKNSSHGKLQGFPENRSSDPKWERTEVSD
jgi:hypothetical protein